MAADSGPKVEVVLKNVCKQLGEGPHWDDATQTLLFVDIEERQVHRWNPATKTHDVKQLDKQTSLVVPRQKGGMMVGLQRRFAQIDWDTDTVTTTEEVEAGMEANRYNDGKCDAKGRLWAGTVSPFGWPEPGGGFNEGGGSLYRLGLDRTVSKQLSGLTISNGLAWTADNRTMYLVDSQQREVYAFDFDLEAGTISNKRTVVKFPADSGVAPEAVPDGMTIDSEDKLWIAFWDGFAVIRFDPVTGKTLQKIDIPAGQTTSAAWGGKNLDELYVTSARIVSDEEFQKQPLAGSLFKITGLGAKGLPANTYQG